MLAVKGEHHEMIDALEVAMVHSGREVELHVEHTWTPGVYARTIFMPKGTDLTSKIHLTEHPYAVHTGRLRVFIDGEIEEIVAPRLGVTKPGTRRILRIDEDTVWTTFHAITPEEYAARDHLAVERRIIQQHDEHVVTARKALMQGAS